MLASNCALGLEVRLGSWDRVRHDGSEMEFGDIDERSNFKLRTLAGNHPTLTSSISPPQIVHLNALRLLSRTSHRQLPGGLCKFPAVLSSAEWLLKLKASRPQDSRQVTFASVAQLIRSTIHTTFSHIFSNSQRDSFEAGRWRRALLCTETSSLELLNRRFPHSGLSDPV